MYGAPGEPAWIWRSLGHSRRFTEAQSSKWLPCSKGLLSVMCIGADRQKACLQRRIIQVVLGCNAALP